MLINLTNHPAAQWPESQKQAAAAYGAIVDVPFPTIPPSAAADDLQELAATYVQRCLKLFKQAPQEKHAVHVMGEMTFVYQFVQQMQKHGVACLASTSERRVQVIGNGEKRSCFCFSGFRAYTAEEKIRVPGSNLQ